MKRVLSRNGSHRLMFDTNESERSCSLTEITIHPEFIKDEKDEDSRSTQIGLVDRLGDSQKNS